MDEGAPPNESASNVVSGSPDQLASNILSAILVIIQIINNSTFKLQNPRFYLQSGKVQDTPKGHIEPCTSDCPVFVKKALAPCGVAGVLVYDVAQSPHRRLASRLAILFSVPFSRSLYEQTFAQHMTETLETPKELYGIMYNKWNGVPSYERGQGNNVCFPRCLAHNGIKVTGTMTANDRATLTITIEDESPPQSKNPKRGQQSGSFSEAGPSPLD